ncbi:major facilitator superfamily protein [Stipitochalara longipes BDJ]|nr:major facilitator superfamily protein [Stipitochalara longipes BDJ]
MSHPTSTKPAYVDVDVEHAESKSDTPEDLHSKNIEQVDDINPDLVRKLLRKVDLRLMPGLGLLYTVSLIDRVNLSVARIAGMDADLKLSIGNRYSVVTLILFVTYIIFDFPGNLILRKLGPATWLPLITFAWGVVTIGMGFTKHWGELLACRAIFGALEGGLFPGCVFLLSCWYTRFEVQKRFSSFYCLGMFASGFSSILAYEMQKLKGVGGLNGWRWIFIIEGIITCVIAVIGFILIIEFPDKAMRPGLFRKKGFLTTRETDIILARIQLDRGDAIAETLTLKGQLVHLAGWNPWEMGILLLCNNVVAYSFAFFLPTILLFGLGFSLERTYELVFPPYVLAAIWMFITAFIGDKFRIRGPLIVFNACFTIIGVAMMGFLTDNVARYAGVFIAVASSNSNIPTIFIGQSKRSMGSIMMIAGGGLGGIIASLVFRQQDAPGYKPGLYVLIALQALTVVLVSKNFWLFSRKNRKADKGELVIEGQVGFRYTY